ncbi:MAG: phosphoglycerate dehydrogenase [Bdellovibrionales bacterium]
MKILLLENIHPIAYQRLVSEGFSVDCLKSALLEDELIEKLKDYEAVGIRSKTQVTASVLRQSSHLNVICNFCIGTNQVDLAAANERGIPVFNAPYSNTRSVAELVIGEIIALARKMAHVSMLAHQGKWEKSALQSHEVRGKTLGIIGYGHIGSQVSVLAESMGLQVIYFDIVKKLPLGNSTPVSSLEELLEKSDFVSLHVPETHETRNMISKSELLQMKEASYLINASRGSVVDINDLVESLKERKLAGAALDVFPVEPKNNQEKFFSELQGLDNVILTPHIGGSTEEAQEAIGREVSESMTRFLKAGYTGGAVNFPNIECPKPQEGAVRIINVHKNVPGVLSQVNQIVGDMGANIISQYLSTDSKIGFLVMDVEKVHGDELSKRVSQLDTSVKTRLL